MPTLINHLVPNHEYKCRFPNARLEIRANGNTGEAHIVAITEGWEPAHGPQERFGRIAECRVNDTGDGLEEWSFSFTEDQIKAIEDAVAPIVARYKDSFEIRGRSSIDRALSEEMYEAFETAVEANVEITPSPGNAYGMRGM